MRTVAENTLLALGKLPTREDGLVNQFTAASQLLDASKPQRKKKVVVAQPQPDLFAL